MSLSFAKPTTRTLIRTLIPIGTALLAFVVTGFLLLAGGFDPLEAYGLILQGSVGGVREGGETLVRTTSLLLTGLAVGFAFRCRVWNIGAEGQLYFGAIGAVVIALTVAGQIPVFGVIIAIIFAMIFGAGWAAIAGVLKSRLGVNEIIVTVMLNFIAILFVDFLVHGALKAPGFEPQTALIPLTSQLPILIEGTRFHAGFLVAIAAAVLIYLILFKTKTGFSLRATGVNPKASGYAGINVKRSILLTLLISGAVAGIAGACLVQGVNDRLLVGISPGYGFIAIIIALLGREHPLGITFVAIFFGALMSGANLMYQTMGIPVAIAETLQAMVLIFALVGEFFARWKFKEAAK